MTTQRHSPAEVRLRRLLAIVFDLGIRSSTRQALSRRYQVSERQITKDLTTIRAAGVTVTRDQLGYRAAMPRVATTGVRGGGRRRFTAEEADAIRERYRAGASPRDLAAEYHVTRGTIYHIVNGDTYRELDAI